MRVFYENRIGKVMNYKTEVDYYNSEYQYEKKNTNWLQKFMIDLYPVLPDASYRILDLVQKTDSVLEIGCGDGCLTAMLAPNCNKLTAIDISEMGINLTKDRLSNSGYVADIYKMDTQDMCFKDSSFDKVVGLYILHHLDLQESIKEIYRVLKPNGIAVFIEPLEMNFISNIWRKLTPSYRTKTEKPLSYTDIKELAKYFKKAKCTEFNFLNLFSSLVYCVTFSEKLKQRVGKLLIKYDAECLNMFKFLKRFSGTIQIEFVK